MRAQATIREFYGVDPQRTEWLGRCVNANAFQRLEGLLEGAADKVYTGGRTDASDRYIEPTVLDYGDDLLTFGASEPMQDEIFGPILPVARFSHLEQAAVTNAGTLVVALAVTRAPPILCR